MKALMKELLSLTEVRQLTEDVENGVSPVLITGVSPVHRAQVEAALHLKTRRPLVVLCPDEREARRQAGDLRVLTGEEPLVLPARELQWRPMEASRQWENQRLAALYRLGSSPVVVTTPEALVQRCIPPRVLEWPVVVSPEGTAPRQHSDALVQSQGCKIPSGCIVTLSASLSRQLTVEYDYVWFVPSGAVKDDLRHATLVALPVPGHGAGEPIGILTRVDATFSSGCQLMINAIRKSMPF